MKHPRLFIVTCLSLATAGTSACAHSSSAVTGPSPDRSNTWGGEHLVVVVSDTGATLEYDCAHGAMSAAPRPDATGRFVVTGTHVFEHGAPVRTDEVEDRRAATYKGQIIGSTMTLSVQVIGVTATLGPFSLKRGDAGRLTRCY